MVKELKIVVMGSEDVGKTTLMEKLIKNIGKVEHNGTTVAIDYGRIEMGDKKFHFFGTPGQERFGFMREIAIEGADYAFLVLDATVGLRKVDLDIIGLLTNKNIPFSVFINKMDLCNESNAIDIINNLNCLTENSNIVTGSIYRKEGLSEIIDQLKII
ncbi:small GTP-binding protein [Methanococcus maripaludis C5]|jgi:small GTP-binding protein|uniref:Small GTP-binding protein n=1 Tax=Methanococcus maripaludis (strain C5 / ATCC BAA-1333) TaxID=402880 RepID=A4G0K4_METM5|nr:GTP-binding protein [Methanococcus maripaludis]ABO35988.1 small GTP-binding protein [Methanococcus maripaludis C5]